MSDADEYRRKAAEFRAKAVNASGAFLRRSFASLAAVYVRLAEQADRNAQTDITYSPPLVPPRDDSTEPSAT